MVNIQNSNHSFLEPFVDAKLLYMLIIQSLRISIPTHSNPLPTQH